MKYILAGSILLLVTFQLDAQSFAGKKMLTTTLSLIGFNSSSTTTRINNTTSTSRATSFQITPELVYGKVSASNLLIAYGIGAGYTYNSSKGGGTESKYSNYLIQPTLIVEKFIAITDRIYYSPLGRLAFGYSSGKVHGSDQKNHVYSGGITFHPLAVTFNLKPRSNLIFLAGNLNVGYSVQKSSSNAPGNPFSTTFKGFSTGAAVNSFTIGFQRVI